VSACTTTIVLVRGRFDPAIDLRGAETLAGDHARTATRGHGHRVVAAPAVGDDHFRRAGCAPASIAAAMVTPR
jgi:hypothetical protein